MYSFGAVATQDFVAGARTGALQTPAMTHECCNPGILCTICKKLHRS